MREKLQALIDFEKKRLSVLSDAWSVLQKAINEKNQDFQEALKRLNEGKDSEYKGLKKIDEKIIFEYGECLIGVFEIEIITQEPSELRELLLQEHRKLRQFIDVIRETKAYFEYRMREHFARK